VTRLRAARVAGFDAVLEPPKAASKPSEFGCSNTKTPIISRKFFFGRVVANENRGLQNLRKSQFWQFAAICSNLLQTYRLPMHAPAQSICL